MDSWGDDQCPVCFVATPERLPCGHALCDTCRARWKHSCPLCRRPTAPPDDAATATARSWNDVVPGDVERTPPFSRWLAAEMAHMARLQMDSARFLRRVVVPDPSRFVFATTEHGVEVVALARPERLLEAARRRGAALLPPRLRSPPTLAVGDLITHVNYRHVLDPESDVHASVLRYVSVPIVCHVFVA